MSVQKRPDVTVRAELTVLVSRHARGDLHDGVRDRLRKIDGVQAIETVDIRGLQPGLNDLTVEVETTLRLRPDAPDDESVAAQLADGFGIKRAVATVDSHTGVG
ncbi:hypothetical protein SAMN04487948_12232 [Halogranum amylolyticum]|uniref:Uncharacterized protein n=1 Tax=Halogranum amylolyticum TaxID=660520 RepID=A0A1H8W3B8_9EURY|nr:hypothetical protein [Halogranum amylolyticum]SEP21658.1 hypothetical protein SAMN04487948_12232 [Halogranum amylolyticum]